MADTKSKAKNIATKGRRGRLKATTVESTPKPTTSEDKAKQKVEELLSDVNLTSKIKKDDLLELDEGDSKDFEWLQEQVSKLSDENEKLRQMAAEAKENYSKLHREYEILRNGGTVKIESGESNVDMGTAIVELFDEFQNNRLGLNPQRTRYSEIKLDSLLAKFLGKFPHLQKYKK